MSREIIAYDIITGADARDLQKLITESLARGWIPHGGVTHNANGRPVQAVVKYKSPNQ